MTLEIERIRQRGRLKKT